MIRKKIVATTLAAASIAGLGAGVALGLPGVSNAATVAQADGTSSTTADASAAPSDASARPDRQQIVSDALAKLVEAGTITQAQSDAVAQALTDAMPARGPGGDANGDGGMHRGGMRGGGNLDTVATALGMTADELRTELQSGKTIADVAAEKGVAVETITAAVKAELQTHLAEEVASGEHTQAEADQILADADARIAAMIDGTAPAGGRGGFGGGPGGMGGGMGRHGMGQPPADGSAPADAPAAPADTATTTA